LRQYLGNFTDCFNIPTALHPKQIPVTKPGAFVGLMLKSLLLLLLPPPPPPPPRLELPFLGLIVAAAPTVNSLTMRRSAANTNRQFQLCSGSGDELQKEEVAFI
jgi:hypothetical protein